MAVGQAAIAPEVLIFLGGGKSTLTHFQLLRRVAWRLSGFLAIPAIGVILSIEMDDWTWFARFGSLMVAASVLDFAMAYVSDQQATMYRYLRDHSPPNVLTDEELRLSSHTETIKRFKQSGLSYFRAVFGAVVGTLIWGFGDLVGVLI